MRPSFDRIAFIYDFLASLVFGKEILRSQQQYIEELPTSGRILFIGGGSGKVLELISRLRPQLIIDYVEPSLKMIRKAKKRRSANEIYWYNGSYEDFFNDVKYEAVLTFYYLDMYKNKEMPDLVSRINTRLSTHGIWLFADFLDTKSYKKAQQVLVRIMYLFFRITTGLRNQKLPDYIAGFNTNGLTVVKSQKFFGGMISSLFLRKVAQ